jgi:anti-anti-sigma factor
VTGQLATLAVAERDGVPVASVAGEIDLTNVAEIGERIARAVPNNALGLVIDLERTSFLDSAGLRLLFQLAQRLEQRGQQLRIAVPDDAVIRKALSVAEVPRVANLHVGVAEAVTELRTQPPATSGPAAPSGQTPKPAR